MSDRADIAKRQGRRPWAEVEHALRHGLRNHWHCLLPSDEVGEKPVAVRRLNENLVVWRDGRGGVHTCRDSCPHRGASLSRGFVSEGALVCRYHGWAYDGAGQCVSIPSEGGACALAGDVTVDAYPTEEHGGLIFAYMSDDARAPDVPCPNPEELESDEWNGFIIRHHWENVPWFRVVENLVDPMHAPFLHAGTYTLGKGEHKGTIAVDDIDGGLFVHRQEQKLINFDYVEFHFPNWFRLDIPYPWSAGPGGPMRIVIFVTPIDADTCQVYMVRKRRISGWKWWLWRALWRLRLERKMWQVIDQDEDILISQRGTACLDDEFLAQSDMGIVRTRRMFTDALERDGAAKREAAE